MSQGPVSKAEMKQGSRLSSRGWRPLRAGRLQAADCRMSSRGTRSQGGGSVVSEQYLLKDKDADTLCTGEAGLQSPLLTHTPLTECNGLSGLERQCWSGRAVGIPAPAESAADNDPEQSVHSMG